MTQRREPCLLESLLPITGIRWVCCARLVLAYQRSLRWSLRRVGIHGDSDRVEFVF